MKHWGGGLEERERSLSLSYEIGAERSQRQGAMILLQLEYDVILFSWRREGRVNL